MADVNERFGKILALAVDPGAHDGEAVAALQRLREMVRRDPTLANFPPPPPMPILAPLTRPDAIVATTITNLPTFWLLIFMNNLSEEAFKLGLRSKMSCDPPSAMAPVAINIRCEGRKAGCDAFEAHLAWLISYINAQPPQP